MPPQGMQGGAFGGGAPAAGGGASSDLLRLLQQAGASGGMLGAGGMHPNASRAPLTGQLSLQDQLRSMQ
jgi:hypothetical protein